mmetsp:Transcript_159816/g.297949  ORF Transcript_159816/g.297949 Transcript_159816/m.297949 type:complete len:208 (-) Transcript_159816:757-1380(-)
MRLLLRQCLDDVAQCGEGAVYGLGFLQANPAVCERTAFANALAASQVHQAQFPNFLSAVGELLLARDEKEDVGPGRELVQARCSQHTHLCTHAENIQHVLFTSHALLCEVVYEYAFLRMLLDSQGSLIRRVQQVTQLLAIDFQQRASQNKPDIIRCCTYRIEDLSSCPRHETLRPRLLDLRSKHAIGFAAAGLPIGQHSAIVAIEHI